ncbi:hypothetical protein Tco_1418653 [Tanacetum coccineum]
MSSPPHSIIIISDFDVEDTFSSTHSHDYFSASPDYFLASPRNTSLNFSDDLTKDLLASLALSPFYDDRYIKVMQAYDATDNELPIPPQSPIAPPTILPPSPVLSLSPMFDSRHFFPPEKISPPKDAETPVESPILISPSSSMPPKRTSTSPAMTQAAIQQLVADSVAAALEAQAATMASTDNPNRNTGPRENACEENRNKFYNLVMKGNDLKTYARRFKELSLLCPNMAPNTEKLMEAFIGGLPRSIEGNVTASKPQTLEEAIPITQRLMDQVTKHDAEQGTNDHK